MSDDGAPQNKISDLRDRLFETLDALKNKEDPMPLERAKAIADIGQVIVNSVKVEVDFLKLMDGRSKGTGFIPEATAAEKPFIPGTSAQPRLVKGRDTA